MGSSVSGILGSIYGFLPITSSEMSNRKTKCFKSNFIYQGCHPSCAGQGLKVRCWLFIRCMTLCPPAHHYPTYSQTNRFSHTHTYIYITNILSRNQSYSNYPQQEYCCVINTRTMQPFPLSAPCLSNGLSLVSWGKSQMRQVKRQRHGVLM